MELPKNNNFTPRNTSGEMLPHIDRAASTAPGNGEGMPNTEFFSPDATAAIIIKSFRTPLGREQDIGLGTRSSCSTCGCKTLAKTCGCK